MKRQIALSLYERLLLSDSKTNKEIVVVLAQRGIELGRPTDIVKEQYDY